MSICFIESSIFFLIFFTKKKQKRKLEKKKTKQIENKIRKGGKINFLPTPPHFIHALSSMYSRYNEKKKYELYLPHQVGMYAGEIEFIPFLCASTAPIVKFDASHINSNGNVQSYV